MVWFFFNLLAHDWSVRGVELRRKDDVNIYAPKNDSKFIFLIAFSQTLIWFLKLSTDNLVTYKLCEIFISN